MAALNLQLKYKEGGVLKPVNVATNIYNVSGLLGADHKIISSLLPSWIVGGMKFIATKSGTATLEGLFNEIESWLENKGISTDESYDEFRGKYFVVGGSGLTLTRDPQGIYDWNYSDDGGDSDSNEITLEPGDWIVYSHYVSGGGSGETGTHFFGFVNNTYDDARENEAGVIKIATQDETNAGSIDDKAITPKKLAAVLSPIKSDITSLENNKQSRHTSLVNLTQLMNSGSTAGFIRKTGQNTYEIDEKSYLTQDIAEDMISGAISQYDSTTIADITASLSTKAPKNNPSFTGTITTPLGSGFVKSNSSGVLSVDNNVVTGVKGSADTTYKTGQVNITKSSIGLGSIQNYEIASESDVKSDAADVNTKYMTPKRTFEAINYWATIPVYSSEAEIPSDLPERKLVFVEV